MNETKPKPRAVTQVRQMQICLTMMELQDIIEGLRHVRRNIVLTSSSTEDDLKWERMRFRQLSVTLTSLLLLQYDGGVIHVTKEEV